MTCKMWTPKPIWRGQSVYIVGGGPSLKSFQWEALFDRTVLGCNAAFYKGPDLIPFTIFGDCAFLHQHRAGLNNYVDGGGIVFTNSRCTQNAPTWLRVLPKKENGLGTIELGWNGNTGASAINLALMLGARKVFLLGFDMQLSKAGEGNFHDAYSHEPNPKVYSRFKRGMMQVRKDISIVFPGAEVINLEDGTSALTEFPKESLKAHFVERNNYVDSI